MAQALLFRDPSPLVERLGLEFFRSLPEGPGIYLMRGRDDALLYLGKAKNLRRRLGSYRVANPDRLPRRHLRLLREVEKIEVTECADESAALEHEARLLRALKPRYNRAGTWTGVSYYFCWQMAGTHLHLMVTERPPPGWYTCGPMGRGAHAMHGAVRRLLWRAAHPDQCLTTLPAGWFGNAAAGNSAVPFSSTALAQELFVLIDRMSRGQEECFLELKAKNCSATKSLFEQSQIQADVEFLQERFAGLARKNRTASLGKRTLLG